MHKLHVHALREGRRRRDLGRPVQGACFIHRFNEHHRVRVGHEHRCGRPRALFIGVSVRRIRSVIDSDHRMQINVGERSRSHIDGDRVIAVHMHHVSAGSRGDRKTSPRIGGDKSAIEQHAGENARTVATHLRQRTISVAIIHKPQRAVAFHARWDHANQTVSADPGRAITQLSDHPRSNSHRSGCRIRAHHEDEVVTRAMALDQGGAAERRVTRAHA